MSSWSLYVFLVLVWGSTWFVIKFQLGRVAPEMSVSYRFLLASVLLFAFLAMRGRSFFVQKQVLRWCALLGLLVFGLNYLLTYLATETLTSGIVAVMFSALPIFNILNSRIFFGRKFESSVMLGSVLGLGGILLLFKDEWGKWDGGWAAMRGAVFALVATYVASLGNMVATRFRQRGDSVLLTNAYAMAMGGLIIGGIGLLRGQELSFDFRLPYVMSLLYLSVFGSALAFGAYFVLLGRLGPERAAYASVLFPVVALLISSVFEDYPWTLVSGLGVLLVLMGNVVVLRRPKQVQEVFRGPVYLNSRPFFYGHPFFHQVFSSTEAISNWWQGSGTNYSGQAVFDEGKQGTTSTVNFPSQMGNLMRLAAGDPSSDAATDTTNPSESELVFYLSTHALGNIPGGTTAVPQGLYIPKNSSNEPTGGIYVKGDARIRLNVVQGASDFGSDYWANLPATHQGCRFQKISVESVSAGFTNRDIFVGDDCDVTYICDESSPTTAPTVLSARLNGNLFVDGSIDEIGGESRTRPALATDFGYTFAATKDVRVINDLQYEDAEYVTLTADGDVGTEVVANVAGEMGGSGYTSLSTDLGTVMEPDSQTVLGLVSM